MKNLQLVSFVGVDERTNLNDLLKVPNIRLDEFNEFSILFSDSKSKQNHIRYPSYEFCKNFLEWGSSRAIHPSLHLCGSVIERYLKQEKNVMELCEKAHRIQLNMNIRNFPSYEKLTTDLISVMTTHKHYIVLQENKTKRNFNLSFLKTIPKSLYSQVSLLHDGSGGFGREIAQIDPPDPNFFTGYAGGINPDNVVKIVNLIENNNSKNLQYYIDMESGVRIDNIFSIEKCQQIIDNLKKNKE